MDKQPLLEWKKHFVLRITNNPAKQELEQGQSLHLLLELIVEVIVLKIIIQGLV